jgi:hypothetical protein
MRWGSDIRMQACESEAPARDAGLFLDVFFTEGSMDVRSGFRRDPCVIEDGGSGRKPPSVSRNEFRPSYRRRGFRRDPLPHREPGVRGCRGRSRRDPCVIEDGCSGRKPLLQRPIFVGAASAATFCVIENQGFEVIRAASAVTLAWSKTESSGLKPLLQKPSLYATFASSRAMGSGLPEQPSPRPFA